MLRLKHFDKNLTGWEEKDKSLIFDVVAISKDEVRFQVRDKTKSIQLTYRRTNDQQLDATLIP